MFTIYSKLIYNEYKIDISKTNQFCHHRVTFIKPNVQNIAIEHPHDFLLLYYVINK